MAASLRDKTVLITGGALGIGAETARLLHAQGARLVLVDVESVAVEKLAAELGGDTVAVTADVRDYDDMERAVATALKHFGGLDVVVANAGVGSFGTVAAVHPEDFKRVIDVNLLGVFHTVRAALPAVKERRGYVLVVSSLAAFAAAPGMAAYDASKAGVEHFANSLRLEVRHEGVDVGVAHMSWIDTPLVRDAKEESSVFARMIESLPGPLSRTTSVETCAQAFVKGIEERRRTVFVPGWVGALKRARNLINSPAGERQTLKSAPELLPLMDDEVRRKGRSTSARARALDD